jgi:hypothetical protein
MTVLVKSTKEKIDLPIFCASKLDRLSYNNLSSLWSYLGCAQMEDGFASLRRSWECIISLPVLFLFLVMERRNWRWSPGAEVVSGLHEKQCEMEITSKETGQAKRPYYYVTRLI